MANINSDIIKEKIDTHSLPGFSRYIKHILSVFRSLRRWPARLITVRPTSIINTPVLVYQFFFLSVSVDFHDKILILHSIELESQK